MQTLSVSYSFFFFCISKVTGLEIKVGVYFSIVSDKTGHLHDHMTRRLLRGAEASVEDFVIFKKILFGKIYPHAFP